MKTSEILAMAGAIAVGVVVGTLVARAIAVNLIPSLK